MLIIISLLFVFPALSASAAGDSLDAKKVAEINKPGVVMIQNWYQATISVPGIRMTDGADDEITNIVWDMVDSGEIPYDDAAMSKAYVDEYLSNLYNYVEANGQTQNIEAQIGFMGTGFIVTPDGYIVTNCHVVYTPDDELKSALAQSGLIDQVTKDLADWVNSVSQYYTPDEAQQEKFKEVDFQFYADNMTLSDVKQTLSCGMGLTVPGVTTIQSGYVCDLRKRGEIVPGKDVAILKIDKQNLPTVTLGDDSGMTVGEDIYVMGYPGVATFNPELDTTASQTESTFTAGIVSARKTMPGGWGILQIDAAATHGNSGGPVFNDKGEAIGILTFGSIDSSNQEIAGMDFAVPISIAKQFLNEINVTPTESTLTTNYKEALSLVGQEKYKKALTLFKKINDTNPGYPYIQDQIASCTKNIDAGKDKSNDGILLYAIIGAAVLVVAGAVIIILVLKSKKKTKKGSAQPMYQAQPNQQPMYQMPPNQQPMYQAPQNQQPMYQAPPNQQPMYQAPPNQQPMPQPPVNPEPANVEPVQETTDNNTGSEAGNVPETPPQ